MQGGRRWEGGDGRDDDGGKTGILTLTPLSFQLLIDSVIGITTLSRFLHRENVEVMKLTTRKGSNIVGLA